tara:strand:- start:314 stop:706 length:393 start_codon:yes stop_codon:yes gene_type:complete
MKSKKPQLTLITPEEDRITRVIASQKEDTALLVNALKGVVNSGNKTDDLTPQLLLQTVNQLDILEQSIMGMVTSIQESNKQVALAITQGNLKMVEAVELARQTDYKMVINRANGTINDITIKADINGTNH